MWEEAVGKGCLWHQVRLRRDYIAGEHVAGDRQIWPREPWLPKPCACYLCNSDFAVDRVGWLEGLILLLVVTTFLDLVANK